ncbi:putative ribonuclease H-like domain-containing protein [Tanacetum coccineum]
MESQSETTQTVSALKLPVLKTGEYDLWSMRMEQYLTFTDHALWEVIVNGDSVSPIASASAGAEGLIPPKTAKQKLARKNELKAKCALMLAIIDEHLLKFHACKDAKSLWEAIKNRFGGNKESKKMQKTILKQNYENFAASSQEGLDKTYDRSLPSAWNNIALIMRNKSDLDTLSMDDLYNNLKVYESKIKSQTSSSSNSQNVAFVSSDNSSSTNETLDNEDLEHIDADDLEEMDLKWAPGNQGNRNRDDLRRNAPVDTSTTNALVVQDGIDGYDWSFQAEEGYQMGLESLESRIVVHEKNETVYKENIAFLKYDVQVKDISIKDLKNQLEEALKEKDDLKLKLEKFEESLKNLTKLINSQISAKDKTGLSYDSQTNKSELINIHMNGSEVVHSVFNNRESDVDDSPVNDRFKTGEGFHAVPPPYTGNYMPPRPDLSFARLDESVFQSTMRKTTTSMPETKTSISKTIVATKSGQVPVNAAKQSSPRAAASISTAKPVNIVAPKPKVKDALPITYSYFKTHSPVRRTFNQKSAAKTNNFNEKVNTARVNNVTTAGPKAVVSAAEGNGENAVKSLACWIWRPTENVIDHISKDSGSYMLKRFDYVNLHGRLKSAIGCSRTGKLDFEDVYFVKELTFNLFSVSQMCDKKNSVLFTETECLVLSPDFKLWMNSVERKGLREYSVARTPQQNRVAERKNRTLIEAARTMLADLLLPTTFWAKAVNTACYVQNKVLVTKPHNKTPYKLLHGSGPDWLFDINLLTNSMNYEPVAARNQTNRNAEDVVADDAGKNITKEPANEGERNGQEKEGETSNKEGDQHVQDLRAELDKLLVQQKEGYANSTNKVSTVSLSVSAARQSFVNDLLTDPFMPDLEDTTDLLNTGISSGAYDDKDVGAEANLNNLETTINVNHIPTTRIHKDHLKKQIIWDPLLAPQTRRMTKSAQEHAMKVTQALTDPIWIEAMQDELLQFRLQKVWRLVDLPKGKHTIGTKWVYRNKKDKRGIVVRNKARLVAQGYTQEEGINYDKVFAPVARIEAIRLFLTYASFMGFIVYQMDVKSAFLYGTIKDKVYVCQPPGFEDPQFPDKVYKVEKALYGLHQAPRASYETLSTYLLENGFRRGTINKTLFIKKDKGDILLVQVYVDDIIFGSTKKSLCVEFEQMIDKRFQMSSIRELTFFLRLQVKQKDDGIFISQDKYVVDILKKFNFVIVKTASTLIETNKALLKDEEAEDVNVHLYRSIIRSLMYLTAFRPDIMFAVCACARFQVTPKVSHLHAVKRIFRYLKGQPKLGLWYPMDSPFDLDAFSYSDYARASLDRKSTTGANCYGHVLWIQNQMLDYGFNFMNTKIHIDNESTICIVKNLVLHSKTKHIEIRHHFIRDSYEKRLIQVIKIHTDHNVVDLITKAFDVSRFNFLIASIGLLNL